MKKSAVLTLPALLGLLLAAASAPAGEENLVVKLRAEGVAAGAFVRLGEAAELSGARAAEAGEVLLGRAPDAGQIRLIGRQLVEERLREEGFPAESFALGGAEVVAVHAAAAPAPAPAPAVKTSAGATGPAEAGDQLKAQAAEWLRAELAKSLNLPIEDVEAVVVSCRTTNLARDAAKRDVQVKWLAGQPRLGRVRVEILLSAGGGGSEAGRLEVVADLAASRTVLVAARDLAVGERLGAEAIRAERVRLADSGTDYLTDERQLAGMVAVRAVKKGAPLAARQLAREVLVHRGQPVTVVAEADGLRLSQAGVARGDGALGDMVIVERLGSRAQLAGRVAGPGTVKVE